MLRLLNLFQTLVITLVDLAEVVELKEVLVVEELEILEDQDLVRVMVLRVLPILEEPVGQEQEVLLEMVVMVVQVS